MSESESDKTVLTVFKGVSVVATTIAVATNQPALAAAAGFLSWGASLVEFCQATLKVEVNGFMADMLADYAAEHGDGADFDDIREKLKSKAGVRTTIAAVRTFFDLIDESAEPPLRRLTLDYALAGKRPDALYRGAAAMLTQCDASDIQDMRAVFGMLKGEAAAEVRLAKGAIRSTNSEGKVVMGMGGGNTIGALSDLSHTAMPSASVLKSVAVNDAARVMRLLDDHRITRPAQTRVLAASGVPMGTISADHAWRLVRAFSQT